MLDINISISIYMNNLLYIANNNFLYLFLCMPSRETTVNQLMCKK